MANPVIEVSNGVVKSNCYSTLFVCNGIGTKKMTVSFPQPNVHLLLHRIMKSRSRLLI